MTEIHRRKPADAKLSFSGPGTKSFFEGRASVTKILIPGRQGSASTWHLCFETEHGDLFCCNTVEIQYSGWEEIGVLRFFDADSKVREVVEEYFSFHGNPFALESARVFSFEFGGEQYDTAIKLVALDEREITVSSASPAGAVTFSIGEVNCDYDPDIPITELISRSA